MSCAHELLLIDHSVTLSNVYDLSQVLRTLEIDLNVEIVITCGVAVLMLFSNHRFSNDYFTHGGEFFVVL